jgi:GDP-D-mannose dehydratase
MSNLIIGSTAQLSNYFPLDYDRMTSRHIDIDLIKTKQYENIYILFAEQRTFLNEGEEFFTNINVDYKIKLINEIKDHCNKIIVYSTSELWNNCVGPIDLQTPFNYNYSPYIKSNEHFSNKINSNKNEYQNVHIIYAFNFNSPFRKDGFLFSKIFDCILNRKKITVGNINMLRDIIHPSYIVDNSINTTTDKIIGSGELINVKNFVRDLLNLSNMEYNDYITEDIDSNLYNQRKEYFSKIKFSSYEDLLKLTNHDIRNYKISKRHH